eukprot:m.307307 g.307307  ORF g.307307 m.307307 type:complete len:567 (+) comp27380_c0_seq1:3594-5294(+)
MAFRSGLRTAVKVTPWFVGGYAVMRTAKKYSEYRTDDDFRLKVDRAAQLWTVGGPVAIKYRFVEAKHKWFPPASQEASDAVWLALDQANSGKILELLKSLKGMYVKYGQISASLTNTFSKVWIDKLRTLEDAVPPQPAEVVLETIRQELGCDPSEVFSEFDSIPLGSASIGQVHRAVLRSTGEEVAVKVQYPDSERLFMSDMSTIRTFFEWVAPEQVIMLSELERSLNNEFDYQVEAENLTTVRQNLGAHFASEAVVPKSYPELSTRRMLVMEMLPGPKLVDGLRKYAEIDAAAKGLTVDELEEQVRAEWDEHGIPTAYDGPSATEIATYNTTVAIKDALVNSAIWAYNGTYGWTTGNRAAYVQTTVPPNPPRIMDTIMRVHGEQLLVHGVFNADPHAGNFLLLPDDRIGLIDYGSTKKLTRGERLVTAVLYVALARHDRHMIFDICRNGGYKSKLMDEDVIYKMTRFGFDSFGRDLLGTKNIQQFTDECFAADPWEETADNLVMVNFLSIRLRSVGLAMQHPVVCSTFWAPIAEKVLLDEGLPYEDWNLELMQDITKGEMRIASS